METEGMDMRSALGMEENLKKALTELLVLSLLSKREYYIGELTAALHEKSGSILNIVFPYGVIYRLSRVDYITECKKRIAPDGRLRQYYRITEDGKEYLAELMEVYRRFSQGVENILANGGEQT